MNRNYLDEQFNSFKNELSSYVFRLVTSKELTEDIVHDTYLKVIDKMESFGERSSFKTWVFTIATNHSKNILKRQNKWVENAQDYGAMLHVKSKEHWDAFQNVFSATPDQLYEIKEHLNYCFNCMNKTLEIEQQVCLLLKEVYSFKVSEIIEITGLTEGKVKHAIANARKVLINIFEHRCAFVNQKGTCHQCSELTGMLNPKQDVHMKAKALKLSKAKNKENKERLLDLRLELVSVIDPLNSKNSLVTTYFLENSEKWVKEGKQKKVLENPSETKS
ncbi:RNA polymerase sigma factor [Flavivirga algicola]|uniref:RNA polymerase sigma factor n=1 Tax=Flavivirga algicola TaxID=2729136 RepID=A0ABX1S1Z4_9FLAO|nr:RNA polymerase sigma factor [Flavivirga algicola]NMH89068.1 RNA polymerase sigma factor [Flavivirga algicola]